jgi:DUF4097 and DUF4098 domain-containing protein YvlB
MFSFDLKFLKILMILFSFLVCSQFAMADSDEMIQKTFSVSPGGILTVDTDIGSIIVQSGASDQVAVEVLRKFRNGDDEDIAKVFDVSFDQQGNNIEIIGEKRKKWGFGWGGIKVQFTIKVPHNFNVDLRTAGGSISVGDLEGTVKSRTSGGSLTFGDIAGPVMGNTSGGSITLDKCQGNVDLRTSGGSIRIGDVIGDLDIHTSGGSIDIDRVQGKAIAKTSGGSIQADEVSGQIDASTSGGSVEAYIAGQPSGDCQLTTSGGTVTVYLDANASVDLDAKSSGGKVDSDFKVMVQGEMRKNVLRGEINGGGPEVYLRTSAGSVYIREK